MPDSAWRTDDTDHGYRGARGALRDPERWGDAKGGRPPDPGLPALDHGLALLRADDGWTGGHRRKPARRRRPGRDGTGRPYAGPARLAWQQPDRFAAKHRPRRPRVAHVHGSRLAQC